MSSNSQLNMAAILLLAGLGFLILGLGAILYHDVDAEKSAGAPAQHNVQTSEIAEKPQQTVVRDTTSEMARSSHNIQKPATGPVAPDERFYAPQNYEPEFIEQHEIPESFQIGHEQPDGIYGYEGRPALSPTSITRQNLSREPNRHYETVPRGGAVAVRRKNASSRPAPGRRDQIYDIFEGSGYGKDWQSHEVQPPDRFSGRTQSSHGTPQTHPRHQITAPVQRYNQSHYSPPQLSRQDAYPATDTPWRAPRQSQYPNPSYSRIREAPERNQSDW